MKTRGKFLALQTFAVAMTMVFGFMQPAHAAVRTTVDLPDAEQGFQIKPVYLLPADVRDTSADTDGTIAGLLTEGNKFLKSQIGREFVIDTNLSGEYDIAFMRTKYTTDELNGSEFIDTAKLLTESKFVNSDTKNRKIYVFFTPIDSGDGDYCGFADNPGLLNLSLFGKDVEGGGCGGPANGLASYAIMTWIHEVFHNLGVHHTAEPCDLMYSVEDDGMDCAWGDSVTIDSSHSLYFGSDLYGVDISKLAVWRGNNSASAAARVCTFLFPNDDSSRFDKALCPIGSTTIGSVDWCWPDKKLTGTLQELVKGKWVTAAKGRVSNNSWLSDEVGSCKKLYDLTAKVTVTAAKETKYRWVVYGKAQRAFAVSWLN
jgi:hypothetical protein